jgi:hypothetical protein
MGSSSTLPDGGYQPTYASNLLLDGFDFVEDYGEGVDGARKDPDPELPRSQNGLSSLPDGFLTGKEACGEDEEYLDTLVETGDEAGLGNLSSLVKTAAPLVDLMWLSEATQDPNRLPKMPNESVLTGLVEAWGVDRRTNGVGLVPNSGPRQVPKPQTSRLPGDQWRDLVVSSERRVSFGEPFENILRDVVAHLGDDLGKVHTDPTLQNLASSLRSLREEKVALGTLYLRDRSFPGLLTGKWSSEIKKHCSKVPYWLTTPGSKLASYQNYLGKKVVTEIPWGQALERFKPYLEMKGVKVASGDPRSALLAGLSQEGVKRAKKGEGVPVTSLVDTVSLEEAWRVFASAPVPAREVVIREDPGLKRARGQVARWVSTGLLSQRDAKILLKSSLSPESLVKTGAARILASGKEVTYLGQGVGVTTPLPRESGHTAEWAKGQEKEFALRVEKRAYETVQGLVAQGSLTSREAEKVLAFGLSPEASVLVATLRSHDPEREIPRVPEVQVNLYKGQKFVASEQSLHSPTQGAGEQERAVAASEFTKVKGILQTFVKNGSLVLKEAERILSSGLDPWSMMRVAVLRANDPRRASTPLPKIPTKDYSGTPYKETSKTRAPVHTAEWVREQEEALKVRELRRAEETLAGLVKTGSLSERDAGRILASGLEPKQMVRVAEARAADPYKPVSIPKSEKRGYVGVPYTAHTSEKRALVETTPVVDRLLRWATVQMNEGFAGKDLDHLLKAKFSGELLKTASEPLIQIRRKHEGLAGHLYVDASAYASPTGVTGCDKGALIHRANAIPSVLLMERCSSCSSNIEGGCLKYGKPLVSAPPVEDPVRYQKETIHLANSEDSERTSSLFTPSYQQGEFDLQNDNLDGFDYDSLPDHATLNEVLFEGMVLPEEEV